MVVTVQQDIPDPEEDEESERPHHQGLLGQTLVNSSSESDEQEQGEENQNVSFIEQFI